MIWSRAGECRGERDVKYNEYTGLGLALAGVNNFKVHLRWNQDVFS